jgi:hypothetical protein
MKIAAASTNQTRASGSNAAFTIMSFPGMALFQGHNWLLYWLPGTGENLQALAIA